MKPTRRQFLQTAAATAASFAPGLAVAQNAPQRPNILVILADDMGYGDLACQNPDSKIPTPNLDRLAADGMRFTDAHSPSAVCTPTRYSLLTGRYCWRTELQTSVLWPWDGPLIEPGRPTLPAMLRDAGYDTACIGKWHLGWDWPTKDGTSINDTVPKGDFAREPRAAFGDNIDFTQPVAGGPTARGFDYYFGDDVPNFAPYCYIENDRIVEMPTVPKPKGMFGTDGPMVEGWDLRDVMPAITERAVDYIKAGAGERPFDKTADAPFFLYFSLTAPHTPIAPSDAFIGTSEAHRYGDWGHQVDHTVGQVLQALEDSGQADNTLVVFTSDNGSPARDGENMAGRPTSVLKYGHNPSGEFRGIKADIWEGGHRVPFIVRWPGHTPAGTVSDALMGHIDLMATCANIADCELPNNAAIDSFDQTNTITDPNAPSARRSLVHHSIQGAFALRLGHWKYIDAPGSGGWSQFNKQGAHPKQLYNMKTDPHETDNQYFEAIDIASQLQRTLDTIKHREGPESRKAQAGL